MSKLTLDQLLEAHEAARKISTDKSDFQSRWNVILYNAGWERKEFAEALDAANKKRYTKKVYSVACCVVVEADSPEEALKLAKPKIDASNPIVEELAIRPFGAQPSTSEIHCPHGFLWTVTCDLC